MPSLTPSPAGLSARPQSQQSEKYDGESVIENLPEDLAAELAEQLGKDMPIGRARHDSSHEPGDVASQKGMEENPRAGSSFLDTVPDLAEMKKQHRQAHSKRSVKGNPHRLSRDVYDVPPAEPRKASHPPKALAVSAKSRVPADKTKLPQWALGPTAQAGSK